MDSHGYVCTLIEREPVKDLKVAFGAEVATLLSSNRENSFGLRITIGQQPVLPRVLSPILMSREVFGSP